MSKNFKIKSEDIKGILLDWNTPRACLATDKITVEGFKVGYMYREEPNDEQDSGWRFFEGTEDEEYTNNSNNIGVYDLNTICNYDNEIVPFLNEPYGTAFYRDEDGNFVKDDEDENFERDDGDRYFIKDLQDENTRTYFKDLKNVRTTGRDSAIGTFILAWNGYELKCNVIYGNNKSYYPICPEPYHLGTMDIPQYAINYREGKDFQDYFTEKDLIEYWEKQESYYQENERLKKLDMEIMLDVQSKLREKFGKEKFYFNYPICINVSYYEITSQKGKIYVRKYNDEDAKRAYYWNIDRTFETLITENIDEAIEYFIKVANLQILGVNAILIEKP